MSYSHKSIRVDLAKPAKSIFYVKITIYQGDIVSKLA